MTVRGIRVWGMIILVAFSLGCGILWLSSREPVSDVTPETFTVRIGVMSPSKSSHAQYVFLGELAREEINEYCEEIESGFRFEFVYNCADVSAPNAIEIAKWYAEKDIKLVMGYEWIPHLHASMRHVLDEDMAVISVGATHYGWAGIWPNVFRLCPHKFRQMEPLARMMQALGKTHVVIIYKKDHWEKGFVNGVPYNNLTGFIEDFEGLGGNVTEVIPYPREFWTTGPDGGMVLWKKYLGMADQAVKDLVNRTGNAAVLLVDYPGGAESLLMKVAEYPALMNATWFMTEPWSTRSILNYASETAAKLKLFYPILTFEETAVYERVNEAYEAEFNQSLGYIGANTYDACWLMALSVIEANTTDAQTIMEVIPEIASDYTGASGPCAIESSLYREAVDYDLYGFFRIGKETQRLKCGSYDGTTYTITWDETLFTSESGET